MDRVVTNVASHTVCTLRILAESSEVAASGALPEWVDVICFTRPFSSHGTDPMSRPSLTLSPLEDRSVPATFSLPRTYAVGEDTASTGAVPAVYGYTQTDRLASFSFDTGTGFTGGVRVARADFTGDGVPDLAIGSGPGTVSRVQVFQGRLNGSTVVLGALVADFRPFETSFTGGIYIAGGDFNGGGRAELVVTPDQGGGPRVIVYDGANPQLVFADFFGIDDRNFRGGARAAIGDINNDLVNDLVVAAGFGGGPRIAVYDGRSVRPTLTPTKLFNDFFVFEQTLRNGVYVTAGDINGDGFDDVVAGGGPGGGPRVYGVSGRDLTISNGFTITPVANFFAGDPNTRGGIRLSANNLDNDTFADIVTGAGPGATNTVITYAGRSIEPRTIRPEILSTFTIGDADTDGIFVG